MTVSFVLRYIKKIYLPIPDQCRQLKQWTLALWVLLLVPPFLLLIINGNRFTPPSSIHLSFTLLALLNNYSLWLALPIFERGGGMILDRGPLTELGSHCNTVWKRSTVCAVGKWGGIMRTLYECSVSRPFKITSFFLMGGLRLRKLYKKKGGGNIT